MSTISLDRSVSLWLLLPIFTITTLTSLLRQGLVELNSDGGAPSMLPGGKKSLRDLHVTSVATWSRMARSAAHLMPADRVELRKKYFVGEKDDGKLCRPPEAGPNPMQQMLQQDPTKMASAMKYNMVFLVLNAGIAYLISYLFSECVVARTPFPLSRSFKSILQRGVDVDNLHPSYVSALSWYFLIYFGSTSFMHLINSSLGLLKNPGTTLETMDPMMGAMMAGNSAGPADPAKTFGQEADAWKMLVAVPFLPDIHQHAVKALKEKMA